MIDLVGLWLVAELTVAQSEPPPPAQPRPAVLCGGREAWIGRRIGEPGLQINNLPRGHRVVAADAPLAGPIDPGRLTLFVDGRGRIVRLLCL
ncbi:MAG: hypothetical protein SF002_00125 [Alphaproteobacteria bacterium]|nr:hypothetical protein [Alphaproteobacteria bacterium]